MTDDLVDKFLRLPHARRKRVLQNGSTRLRRTFTRHEWVREEVESFLITNRILSIRHLRQHRASHPDCPTELAIVQLFGSWTLAKKAVFPELFTGKTLQTPEQLVVLVGRVPVTSWREYQRQRRANPGLFPSCHTMQKWFGSWHNLKRLACARQWTNVMDRYIILKQQLGRWPTNRECEDAGVEIDWLLRRFKNRNDMREMAVLLEQRKNT